MATVAEANSWCPRAVSPLIQGCAGAAFGSVEGLGSLLRMCEVALGAQGTSTENLNGESFLRVPFICCGSAGRFRCPRHSGPSARTGTAWSCEKCLGLPHKSDMRSLLH